MAFSGRLAFLTTVTIIITISQESAGYGREKTMVYVNPEIQKHQTYGHQTYGQGQENTGVSQCIYLYDF